MNHDVTTTAANNGFTLVCSCGWSGSVTQEIFAEALAVRHILQQKAWPFDPTAGPRKRTWSDAEFSITKGERKC